MASAYASRFYFRTILRFARRVFSNPTKSPPSLLRRPLLALTGTTGASLFGVNNLLGWSLFSSKSVDDKKKEDKTKDLSNFYLVIKEADALYETYLIENAYNLLRRYKDSDNTEMLWRLARVTYEKGKIQKDSKERARLTREAFELVEKALKNEPERGSFGVHKWYAILLNAVGELDGIKARLQKCNEVRQHLERSLELNDRDPTTWHILGVWHFTFADLPGYQRLVAKTLFTSPPSSTYEEALRHFEKAENLQPKFYSANQLYMGETLQRMGRSEEARQCFIRAFNTPLISVDDAETQGKALKHLKQLGISQEDAVKYRE